jgi:hypothetical protein
VIGIHYDELSKWAHEAGIPTDAIYSAQGLIHGDPAHEAFAVRIDSPSRDYDSAGVSVEGSIPRDGHLGAILYGRTARNDVTSKMDTRSSRRSSEWTTDGRSSNTTIPTSAIRASRPITRWLTRRFATLQLWRGRSIRNAWNGPNGIYAGQPGYVSYTAWRNTPAEYAMRDFLVAHADVPLGAKLWSFGSIRRADTDGWAADAGSIVAGNGYVDVVPDRAEATLLSPPDLVIRPGADASLRCAHGDAFERPSLIDHELHRRKARHVSVVGVLDGEAVVVKAVNGHRADGTRAAGGQDIPKRNSFEIPAWLRRRLDRLQILQVLAFDWIERIEMAVRPG